VCAIINSIFWSFFIVDRGKLRLSSRGRSRMTLEGRLYDPKIISIIQNKQQK